MSVANSCCKFPSLELLYNEFEPFKLNSLDGCHHIRNLLLKYSKNSDVELLNFATMAETDMRKMGPVEFKNIIVVRLLVYFYGLYLSAFMGIDIDSTASTIIAIYVSLLSPNYVKLCNLAIMYDNSSKVALIAKHSSLVDENIHTCIGMSFEEIEVAMMELLGKFGVNDKPDIGSAIKIVHQLKPDNVRVFVEMFAGNTSRQKIESLFPRDFFDYGKTATITVDKLFQGKLHPTTINELKYINSILSIRLEEELDSGVPRFEIVPILSSRMVKKLRPVTVPKPDPKVMMKYMEESLALLDEKPSKPKRKPTPKSTPKPTYKRSGKSNKMSTAVHTEHPEPSTLPTETSMIKTADETSEIDYSEMPDDVDGIDDSYMPNDVDEIDVLENIVDADEMDDLMGTIDDQQTLGLDVVEDRVLWSKEHVMFHRPLVDFNRESGRPHSNPMTMQNYTRTIRRHH